MKLVLIRSIFLINVIFITLMKGPPTKEGGTREVPTLFLSGKYTKLMER